MKKTSIIWAVILIVAGVTCIGGIFMYQTAINEQAAEYRQIYGLIDEQFVSMYHDWRDMSPKQKADSDLQKYQKQRLKGDLAALATDAKKPDNRSAIIMYGPEWLRHLNIYRKAEDIIDATLIAAASCIVGGMIIICSFFAVRLAEKKKQGRLTRFNFGKFAALAPEDTSKVDMFMHQPEQAETELQTETVIDNEEKTPEEKLDAPEAGGTNVQKKSSGTLRLNQYNQERQVHSAMAIETRLDRGDELIIPGEPVSKSLTDITEEMSAIREYASVQQNMVNKFQDGYDWTIIKRFCVRIIRNIDNLDCQMAQLSNMGMDISALGDVRDELIFSLESSGVEQFLPEIESVYKGQERSVEVIKDRVATEDTDMAGKIAEVVRPGYQYIVNDGEEKIVRCAQVKLYK